MADNFHKRFAIRVNSEHAKSRFIARIENRLFPVNLYNLYLYGEASREIANALGVRHQGSFTTIGKYIDGDFLNCLQAIEAFYKFRTNNGTGGETFESEYDGAYIDQAVRQTLFESEIDLGIRWESGQFHRTGAGTLDRGLVNDELRWLSS